MVVLVHVSVEHGTLGNVLGVEPDTNVELVVSVDGARIGRAVVEIRQGGAEVVSCTAAIRVAPGLRRVTASLHPYDAGLKVGDHSVVSLPISSDCRQGHKTLRRQQRAGSPSRSG